MTPRRGVFQVGDHVQLRGPKGTLHTVTLEKGGSFHTHKGQILHDDVLGLPEGSVVNTDRDIPYLALRPLLSDFVLSMARGAAIIYPKDAAQIVSLADIQPGHRVMEAGVGSGALSMSILRAIGEEGSHLSRAESGICTDSSSQRGDLFRSLDTPLGHRSWRFPGTRPGPPGGQCRPGRLGHVGPVGMYRRGEPCVDPRWCSRRLRGDCDTALSRGRGGQGSGRFTRPESLEVLLRPWHVEGLAVRPEHRMIGHTGFLMTARALAPGVALPETKRRGVKPEYSDDDVEVWTPGATGQRQASDKKIRKTMREAQDRAAKSARKNL